METNITVPGGPIAGPTFCHLISSWCPRVISLQAVKRTLFLLFFYIYFFSKGKKKKASILTFITKKKKKKSLLLFPSWIRRKGFGRLFTVSLYAMNNLVQSVSPKKDCTKFNMTIHNWCKNHLDSEINSYT